MSIFFFFFFNDTATTEIYTLSLHDALPISCGWVGNGCCETVDSNLHLRHFSKTTFFELIAVLRRYVKVGFKSSVSFWSSGSRRASQSFSMSFQGLATLSGSHRQRLS